MEQEVKYKFSNREEYVRALDSVMPSQFIKTRQAGQETSEYLPIPIQEAIADDIFFEWNVTDERYQVIANELGCTVRITYTPSYPGAPELYCTGTAFGAIQMDSNSNVSDFPAKKKVNALEYCAPARRSAAIGCALNSLGNIFGRNLGRKISKNEKLSRDFRIRIHDKNTEAK